MHSFKNCQLKATIIIAVLYLFNFCAVFALAAENADESLLEKKGKETESVTAENSKTEEGEKNKSATVKNIDKSPVLVNEMIDLGALNRWMTYYYLHPQPELFVPALLLADKHGLLQGDAAPPLQSFSALVMAQNPEKINDWFTALSPLSEKGKTVLLTAIWWSRSSQGKELLEKIAAQLPEKPRAEFRKQIAGTPPAVEKMEIESPDVLDMLWGAFCATGDEKYLKHLMTTLSWGKDSSKDFSKMLIASAARWSLGSNIAQHDKVREICLSLSQTDQELKPYLESLLAEADASKTASEKKSPPESTAKNKGKKESSRKDKQKRPTKELELKSQSQNQD